MKDFSILKSMKQSLQNLLCVRDGRMKISGPAQKKETMS